MQRCRPPRSAPPEPAPLLLLTGSPGTRQDHGRAPGGRPPCALGLPRPGLVLRQAPRGRHRALARGGARSRTARCWAPPPGPARPSPPAATSRVAEGILYPFMLDLFADAACEPLGISVNYAVLGPPSPSCSSASSTAGGEPQHAGALADAAVVDDLWTQFERHGVPSRHRVDAGTRTPDEIAAEIDRRLRAGDLLLGPRPHGQPRRGLVDQEPPAARRMLGRAVDRVLVERRQDVLAEGLDRLLAGLERHGGRQHAEGQLVGPGGDVALDGLARPRRACPWRSSPERDGRVERGRRPWPGRSRATRAGRGAWGRCRGSGRPGSGGSSTPPSKKAWRALAPSSMQIIWRGDHDVVVDEATHRVLAVLDLLLVAGDQRGQLVGRGEAEAQDADAELGGQVEGRGAAGRHPDGRVGLGVGLGQHVALGMEKNLPS